MKVLLTAFDVVDDTVALKKSIFPEIFADLENIASDRNGRKVRRMTITSNRLNDRHFKVLLYILSPRNPSYFAPDVIEQLADADSNPHSKKSREVKQQELLDGMSAELIKASSMFSC